ncbi:hypothetical protein VTN77DRAFT_326 [Rasamsonia byssochlamydoides]|uniref:uncharacterized protein n=1 Tax=Rasamsonia byssochlamydoides TaxID=89139 RepID=UPI0037422DFE
MTIIALFRAPKQRILFSTGLCLIFLFLAAFLYAPASLPSSLLPARPALSDAALPLKSDRHCAAFTDSPDVVVVVKTGANVIYDKLPTHLLTTLRCCKDILILSDLEHQLGPYHVYDVLKNVSDTVKQSSPDFDYYRTLQEYQRNGQDIRSLRTERDAAWNLDKYKFIHMLEKSWQLRPGHDWYVFVEADTYLVWSNLLLWLKRLDPSEPLYLGSPTYLNFEAFAHGGSGIILSGAALSKVLDNDPDLAARYDVLMMNERFGDYVLMKALEEKGINLSRRWPMLQAERPRTIPFGPGPASGVRHWCQPIVTMHGVTPGDVSAIWEFEQQRLDVRKPLLIHELYDYFVGHNLTAERDDWYNLSDDAMYRAPGVEGDRQKPEEEMTALERLAYRSFEDCGRACEEHPRCYQFVHHDQECGFSFSYRLGGTRQPEGGSEKRYKSGWNLDKIARDREANPCRSPQWL